MAGFCGIDGGARVAKRRGTLWRRADQREMEGRFVSSIAPCPVAQCDRDGRAMRGGACLREPRPLYHGGPLAWAFTPKIFRRPRGCGCCDAARQMGPDHERSCPPGLRNRGPALGRSSRPPATSTSQAPHRPRGWSPGAWTSSSTGGDGPSSSASSTPAGQPDDQYGRITVRSGGRDLAREFAPPSRYGHSTSRRPASSRC